MDTFYISLYIKNPTNQNLIDIMKVFYGHQAKNNFRAIDKILGEINFHRLSDVIIVSILRCNYRVRDKLHNYDSFLGKATKKYAGTDKEKILKGLELKEK